MRRSAAQFCEEIKIIHPSIKVVGMYTKAAEPILVECLDCGKQWSPKAYSLLSGKGCPHCSAIKGAHNNIGKTGLKNQDTFIEQMKSKHPNISVLGIIQSLKLQMPSSNLAGVTVAIE